MDKRDSKNYEKGMISFIVSPVSHVIVDIAKVIKG